MAAMHWIVYVLAQIWPNLAASAITFGTGMIWHHIVMRRHLGVLHDHISDLHTRLDELTGPAAPPRSSPPPTDPPADG